MALASKTNTTLHTWPERQIVYDSDSSRVPDSEVAEIAEGFWSIVSDAFAYSRENKTRIPKGESLFDFIKREVEGKWRDEDENGDGGGDSSDGVVKTRRRRLLKEAEMWGAFVGSPVQTQSLKFFWLEETINGENPFVASTYQKIMEEIARPALTSSKVVLKLGTRVDAVRYGNGDGGVVVIEVEGRQEEYDEVIVTAPLGWLQRNQDTFFDPPLPERLSKAIKNIGYGNLDKVLITFPKAFWEEENRDISSPQGGDTSSNSKALAPNVTATTQPYHQASQSSQQQSQSDDANGHYPPFTLFYSDKESHIQNAMNLAGLPKTCAHPTLLFYIFGSCAAEVSKLTSDTDIINYFRPHFSLIQNYSSSNPDCEPSAVLSTNWTTDELAGYGSYSTFRTGLEEGDADIEIMREGLPERHVWFAGEHTSPFEAFGTVTGAYWSGEGVAGRILKVYGMDVKE